ncbi:unnamed protein product [Moneuplotes crassus]|uniref:Cyclin-like domain-containing protein n=1 Tax=Euplotes crassus TaxID=5936 RepID=A0AAD1XIG3_EUPCR|nr:unnamed protein product [Moneuplotes crassus]|eukprot:CAMPEP_0196999204 /NCGR_PEP_ID=MMETSP1380-20130617/4432_1 /TAXON_ID=5936 /ORGANISM="Euplotes crassus, Strain CT5" /LENGTH=153 /DNA_ID=CAMNT_0042416043 /DNA_START=41 /DNA_END=502 /DNA_ORIENTATION=-
MSGDAITLIPEARVMATTMTQINKVSRSAFKCRDFIKMSLDDYLQRIYQYSECHESCFVMAMIFIERVLQEYSASSKSLPFNVYTLCLASMVLAIKLSEDDTCNNEFYARLGGVSNDEMVELELELLKLIKFDIFISKEEFTSYQKEMISYQS